MTTKFSVLVGVGAMLALSGCIDQTRYESTPVQVASAQGTVVCQLYRLDQVLWDEAIAAPAGMSIEVADQICINEGFRILEGG